MRVADSTKFSQTEGTKVEQRSYFEGFRPFSTSLQRLAVRLPQAARSYGMMYLRGSSTFPQGAFI